LGASTPPTAFGDESIQVVEGGVTFGIDDLVHVLGATDHAKLGDRFVLGSDVRAYSDPSDGCSPWTSWRNTRSEVVGRRSSQVSDARTKEPRPQAVLTATDIEVIFGRVEQA
jgi:hypothetical protein